MGDGTRPTSSSRTAPDTFSGPRLLSPPWGIARRPTTIIVAIADLSFVAARDTTLEEINAVMKKATATEPLAGILRYSATPSVSIDFNYVPASTICDATLTRAGS